jgi:beta-glucosidase
MKKFQSFICFVAILVISSFSKVSSQEIWKNPSKSFEVRTNDLVSKLTLEEKTKLMRFDSPGIDRLGIKAYNWWNECLHGVARSGQATVFPQAIGMAAMWDTNQMFAIANAISDEARAKYNNYQKQGKFGIYQGLTFWTPNINIFRDPRWGRGMETYGEDPFLTAEMAIPFIKGLQGNDPRYLKLVATVKHFAVHSGPESTRHSATVWPTDYDLYETYLPHFERTIKEGGAYSVMCAYQRLRGIPCCGSQYLENILRNNWNFQGYIVSDCGAIQDFYDKKAHNMLPTPEEASAMAVKAGTDLNCGSVYARSLLNAVNKGLITESEIDRSVKRLIMARMKLGEFDPETDVPFSNIPLSVVDGKEHQAIALDAARKSMVLLKNDKNTLPFSKNIKRIAVIGPNANNNEILLGNYNGYSMHEVTPLQGIRNKLPKATVKYAPGCRLADELPLLTAIEPEFFYTDKSLKTKGITGSYYSRADFKGEVVHTRIDKNIDFVWWTKAPFDDMNPASFSIRWEGVLVPPVSGKYAIGGEAFNGFDIYVNGEKLVKGRKSDHDPRREYEFIELEAGKKYDIRFDYLQNNTEYAIARLVWDKPNNQMLKEAIDVAKSSDIVILCMGLSPSLEGEEMKVKVAGFDHGDRLDIQLPAVQTKLMKEIMKLGKPTVLVLLNGSAIAFNWESENIPAILEAWYPGQAGGTAIADILFGDYNPSGRLPLTFYKSIDQIPAFDVYDMKGKTYRYFDQKPLYEFGFGLSYSNFEYSKVAIPIEVKAGENIKVSVNVKNISKISGEEVVQLYVSLPESKLQTSIRSLQGFKRVYLKAGETKTVEFELKPTQFAARDNNNVQIIEPGTVEISIGGKQPDESSIAAKKVVKCGVKVLGHKFIIPN